MKSKKTMKTKGTKTTNAKQKIKKQNSAVLSKRRTDIDNMSSDVTQANRENLKPKRAVATKRRLVYEDDPKTPLTGILSLNDDCFQEIFTYLNADDLLNVSASNTRFKFACQQVFKRRYCDRTITVWNIDVDNNRFNAHKLKRSIEFLTHFGSVISKLFVCFKLDKIDSLLDAIVANCDENLLELHLHHFGIRVRKTSPVYDSCLSKMISFLSNLNTQFPHLRHLKLKYYNKSKVCPYSDAIIQSISSLTSFATNETAAGLIFSEEKMMKFVRLNRQLECVSFVVDQNFVDDTERSWIITDRFIQCLDESLPMLKSVEINRAVTSYLPAVVDYPIRFKNLKVLKFYSFLEFQRADAGFMSFLSDSVEVLTLSNFSYNIFCFNKNVTQFKNLKVLKLEYTMGLAESILDGNQMERTVWQQHGIEQLILYNKNLTEIVLSLHPSEYGDDTLNLIFAGVTEYTADGSRWRVSPGLLFSYVFSKVLE